jgi:hypothetical protein
MLIQITQMMRIRIHNTDLNDPNIKINRTNSYQKNVDIAHVVARYQVQLEVLIILLSLIFQMKIFQWK